MSHAARQPRSWLIFDVGQRKMKHRSANLICLLGIATLLGACSTPDIGSAIATGVCCVHHVPMKRESAPIAFGFILEPEGFAFSQRARRNLFPFARRHADGQCDLPVEGGPRTAEIFVCSQCEETKQGWIRLHPRDPWAKIQLATQEPNKAPEPTPMAVTPRAIE